MRKGATMPHVDTPWVGLAALVAMFVIPFLPSWLFEGPRTIRHRPRRQPEDRRPLQGQLRRVATSKALVPRRRSVEKIGNS